MTEVSRRTAYATAVQKLLAAQKPARGTAAYSRHVNRPLGRRVAAWGSTVGMTPDQATGLSAVLSGSGIALLATVPPRWWSGLLIGLLLAAGYVMDSVDGQLARLGGGGSARGEWLDHTVDCFKTSTLHAAVLIGFFRWPPVDSDAVLLIPLGYLVVATATFFGWILMWSLRAAKPTSTVLADPAPESPWRRFLLLPTDYGALCIAFSVWGLPVVFLAVYSFFFIASAGALALALMKWWRELSEWDRARSAQGTVVG